MEEKLEIYIKTYNDLKINKDIVKSIDKEYFFELVDYLIKSYKELEEENSIQKSQLMSAFDRGFIHKSLVEEKIEELNKQLEEDLQDERKVNSNRFIIICQCKNCLQELLEKR